VSTGRQLWWHGCTHAHVCRVLLVLDTKPSSRKQHTLPLMLYSRMLVAHPPGDGVLRACARTGWSQCNACVFWQPRPRLPIHTAHLQLIYSITTCRQFTYTVWSTHICTHCFVHKTMNMTDNAMWTRDTIWTPQAVHGDALSLCALRHRLIGSCRFPDVPPVCFRPITLFLSRAADVFKHVAEHTSACARANLLSLSVPVYPSSVYMFVHVFRTVR
jgi:hypothetical protein